MPRVADEFTQGMVCAAAILAYSHGEDTLAKEILRCCGKINWRQIDVYDRDKLKQAGIKLRDFTHYPTKGCHE